MNQSRVESLPTSNTVRIVPHKHISRQIIMGKDRSNTLWFTLVNVAVAKQALLWTAVGQPWLLLEKPAKSSSRAANLLSLYGENDRNHPSRYYLVFLPSYSTFPWCGGQIIIFIALLFGGRHTTHLGVGQKLIPLENTPNNPVESTGPPFSSPSYRKSQQVTHPHFNTKNGTL